MGRSRRGRVLPRPSPTRRCRSTGSGSATPTGRPRPTWCRCRGAAPRPRSSPPPSSAPSPESQGENYAYDAMRDRDATVPWLTHLVGRLDRRADALPPGRGRLHPRGPARRRRLHRAEQHLAGLRRERDPQAVPPAGARAQPRRRDPRRAAPDREPAHRRRCSGTSRSTTRPGGEPATVGDAAGLRAQRHRGLGVLPRPVFATSTARPTCTPTRWAVTSPVRACPARRRDRGGACGTGRDVLGTFLRWNARTPSSRSPRAYADRLDPAAASEVPDLAAYAELLLRGVRHNCLRHLRRARRPFNGCTETSTSARCCGRWTVGSARLRGRAGPAARGAPRPRLAERDVAGMLRSFDYAARHLLHDERRPPA